MTIKKPKLDELTLLDGFAPMIEAGERRGQQELVHSEQLPAEMHGDARTVLEARGVVFRGPSEGDDLFVDVTLPVGWTKRNTNHAMWTELVDADGVVVAEIFFKAAFYDRRAFLNLKRTLA